jgi:hypothetical protein
MRYNSVLWLAIAFHRYSFLGLTFLQLYTLLVLFFPTGATQTGHHGCWNNPVGICTRDMYAADGMGVSFRAATDWVTCLGPRQSLRHVGITTHQLTDACQGSWTVFCNDNEMGIIEVPAGGACTGSAMANAAYCALNFEFTTYCSSITLQARSGMGRGCCMNGGYDSLITAISAW